MITWEYQCHIGKGDIEIYTYRQTVDRTFFKVFVFVLCQTTGDDNEIFFFNSLNCVIIGCRCLSLVWLQDITWIVADLLPVRHLENISLWFSQNLQIFFQKNAFWNNLVCKVRGICWGINLLTHHPPPPPPPPPPPNDTNDNKSYFPQWNNLIVTYHYWTVHQNDIFQIVGKILRTEFRRYVSKYHAICFIHIWEPIQIFSTVPWSGWFVCPSSRPLVNRSLTGTEWQTISAGSPCRCWNYHIRKAHYSRG